ncbi:hypothetical protein GM658_08940 [Pseudoduganella eburnea]|uniref:General secretion pathway protein GspM n=2 Tax=Massilia eburnea TaxID=1776165 RepID=A0A6L6QEV0_9BURK|nr:hypothetical protein [Massilia eburnea]
MESAMNAAALMLRVRIAAMRLGAAGCIALAVLLAGAAALAWSLKARQLAYEPLPPAPAQLTQAAPPPTANENLAHFYDTLGEKRHAEQQVKQLFDIAAKTGLALDQGDYKFSVDKASRVAAYQVTLPVKGAYQNIWQFSLQALTAIPFASLDDIAFRRETISEPVVEARLRFTLYLKDKP